MSQWWSLSQWGLGSKSSGVELLHSRAAVGSGLGWQWRCLSAFWTERATARASGATGATDVDF